jgi:hypothetical protein
MVILLFYDAVSSAEFIKRVTDAVGDLWKVTEEGWMIERKYWGAVWHSWQHLTKYLNIRFKAEKLETVSDTSKLQIASTS